MNIQQCEAIAIAELRGNELGELLSRNRDALPVQMLNDETVVALLQSDVPDKYLRSLPIFPSKDGQKLIAAKIWREEPNFFVPQALARFVPILRRLNHEASDAHMERLVSPWTPSSLIEVALRQPQPQHYAKEILSALEQNDVSLLPEIQGTKWLTDQRENVWAPSDILDLDPDILNAARQTLGRDCSLAFLPIDELSPQFLGSDVSELLRKNRVFPDKEGSLERLMLLVEDKRPVALIGDGAQVALQLKEIANNGVVVALPGWPLLAALLRLSDRPAEEVVRSFGKVERGDCERAAQFLSALEKPISDSKMRTAAWPVYRAAFKELGQWDAADRKEVFNCIRVRTAADTWENGTAVAHAGGGIVPKHLLHRELREFLPNPAPRTEASNLRSKEKGKEHDLESPEKLLAASAASLKPILEFARPHVPSDLLLLLVGLVGRTDSFSEVSRQCLEVTGQDIARVWDRIDSDVARLFQSETFGQNLEDKRLSRIIEFKPLSVPPSQITAETLAGTMANLPTGEVKPLGVFGNIHIGWRNFFHKGQPVGAQTLQIATFGEATVSSADVKALCMTLAAVFIGHRKEQGACLDALDRLADECDRLDQATVDAARAELEDRLPQVLDELKPQHGSGLWEARKAYTDRIDALPVGKRQEEVRPAAKRELWEKVASPKNADELLNAIRLRIKDYGYDPSRVLFELFQNADDATHQHPGSAEGRFRLEYGDDRLIVSHWGRLINHPGPDVDEGMRRRWRSDLFNMLLMNLSEKREDVTGKFGLGFKSVHLLSKRVSIASHFVSCRIKGGMLPEAWAEGRELSVRQSADGRPATVINVEIEPARRADAGHAFAAFVQAAAWLPSMSRSVRHIEIDGSGEWSAEYSDLGTCETRLVSFCGRGSGYALALDLGDETTLFLPLDMRGPVGAPEGLPRLWLLAPLAETLSTGWLMNGRGHFRVDPGRGRLAGRETEREEMFAELGKTLGLRLGV